MEQAAWIAELESSVGAGVAAWDAKAVDKYSSDYHYFSPILKHELKGSLADCIATPRDEQELEAILSFAAEKRIPVTIRGNGTGNYGQCIPMDGGIVLNLVKLDRIVEIGDGYMRVQAGAKLGKMEAEARKTGQELRIYPSTYLTATIGGYLSGGFAGIGSIRWGTIWDGLVRSLSVKTLEQKPRTLLVEGEKAVPYIHTYGTIGVLSEVEISIVPRVEWMQWIVTFAEFEAAARFALEAAEDGELTKRLVSCHEWPIPSYFTPFKLPAGRAAVLLEMDERCEKLLLEKVHAHQGEVTVRIDAGKYHRGQGISDFSFNHTTLWAIKSDPSLTYLQVSFQREAFLEQIRSVKAAFPGVATHLEFNRKNGSLLISGLPLFPYEGNEALGGLIDCYAKHGVGMANPHKWKLEDGGRSYPHDKLWAIKNADDPHHLLNTRKLGLPVDFHRANLI
ncbi:FAD-binding oxidoreductase [Paenibacillus sp. y28]|uniref:FAD-binding oxidoreductase n=1 Tax=Paenibacillus sp. y28 TaxID=3129110 RepID=UPI0030169137